MSDLTPHYACSGPYCYDYWPAEDLHIDSNGDLFCSYCWDDSRDEEPRAFIPAEHIKGAPHIHGHGTG